MVGRISGKVGVVGFGCEGIVEDFIESFGGQLFADEVTELVVLILEALRRES